jgi:hypothetical protein
MLAFKNRGNKLKNSMNLLGDTSMPDLTKITWQLNIALAGAVFSIFALIHNTYYIYYGFLTFLFGAIGHFIDLVFALWLVNKKWRLPAFFTTQGLLFVSWIVALVWIY